jgi:hypothetical protein
MPNKRAFYYKHALGFDLVGYSGPETGRARPCFLLDATRQNPLCADFADALRFGLLQNTSRNTGDACATLPFETNDAKKCYELAVQRGAVGVQEPTVLNDEHGTVIKSAVQTTATRFTLSSSAKITTAFSFRLLSLNHIQTALQNARCLRRLTILSAM